MTTQIIENLSQGSSVEVSSENEATMINPESAISDSAISEPAISEPARSRNIIHNPDDIEALMPEIHDRIDQSRRAIAKGHAFAVTREYLENVIGMPADPADPLLSVIFPDESDVNTENDVGHLASIDKRRVTKSDAITQKYIGSVIMTVTSVCHQRCAHCFRKNVNDTIRVISEEAIEQAFEELDSVGGDDIFDVIMSGGEPLTVKPALIEKIASQKDELNRKRAQRGVPPIHISINTREPVVMPSSILNNPDMIEAIRHLDPLVISMQILHPREITQGFKDIMQIFHGMGIGLRTNHPILKGVNDDPAVLVEMYTKLAGHGVFPKDLIHPIKSGIPREKCVTLERSMEIMRELIRRLPGTLLPRLQCCTPNLGKSFIDPFHMKKDGTFGYDVENDEIIGLRTKDGEKNQPASAM